MLKVLLGRIKGYTLYVMSNNISLRQKGPTEVVKHGADQVIDDTSISDKVASPDGLAS